MVSLGKGSNVMPGSYLLDTNVVIYAINRRLSIPAARYAISIITEMELLSFPRLSEKDESEICAILQAFAHFGISEPVKKLAIDIRRKTSMKLPDAIISATALHTGYTLVTNDAKLAEHHPGQTLTLEKLIDV